VHFIDLCQYDRPAYSPQSEVTPRLKSAPANINEPWIGGAEIFVQDKTYWLHDPVEEQWSDDHSVVQRRARAQQAQTNRKVWLKQVWMFRPTTIASRWQKALRREGRLLEELEQEPRSTFPRLLSSHETEQSITIIYTVTAGKPLTEVFGLRNRVLDAFSARTLLRNIYPVCAMLEMLHRKGLAHRNLTPETILVQGDGHIVLQDVGLAGRTFEPGEGPQLYQAPEQVHMTRGLSIPGPHTDIYQLGKILYHILNGHLPSTPLPDEPAGEWNGELSVELYRVLQRATALAVKDRWSSMRAFSNALRRVAK